MLHSITQEKPGRFPGYRKCVDGRPGAAWKVSFLPDGWSISGPSTLGAGEVEVGTLRSDYRFRVEFWVFLSVFKAGFMTVKAHDDLPHINEEDSLPE